MASSFPEGLNALLDSWSDNGSRMRSAFGELCDHLSAKNGVTLEFKARPGISYSLRGVVPGTDRPLFTMIDVIDDDPSDRWLSVCFYGDMITDPDEAGDFVPGGLLGQDGHCFDLDGDNAETLPYLKARIDEAFASASEA